MLIHVVKMGDTLYRIALLYGIPVSRIISDNGMTYPYTLVLGQALIITQPEVVHTVRSGESPYSIALRYGITVQELYQNNPELADRNPIFLGQTLTISFKGSKERGISVNGYAYPHVNRHVLRRTLPYLSYLSIFSYGIQQDGTILQPDDEDLIQLARIFQAQPVLVLTSIDESGTFSTENTTHLLTDVEFQNKVLRNLIAIMQQKGYRGMDSDFEYIPEENAEDYVAFLENAHRQLSEAGLFLHTALAPKTSANQPGLLYSGHRYPEIGAASDRVLLMTYEWGYT